MFCFFQLLFILYLLFIYYYLLFCINNKMSLSLLSKLYSGITPKSMEWIAIINLFSLLFKRNHFISISNTICHLDFSINNPSNRISKTWILLPSILCGSIYSLPFWLQWPFSKYGFTLVRSWILHQLRCWKNLLLFYEILIRYYFPNWRLGKL